MIYVPAINQLAKTLSGEAIGTRFRGRGMGALTSHELEGLGLEGLLGVIFRNGTHFYDV